MFESLWTAPGAGSALAWFHYGQALACTTRIGQQDGEPPEEYLTIRAAANGAVLRQFDVPCIGPVLAVACAPGSERLATAGSDTGEVEVWHASGDHLLTYQEHPFRVEALAWSPDGVMLASAGSELRVWHVATGETLAYWLLWGRTLAWSPDGQQLALACTDQSVQVLDVAQGTLRCLYRGHQPQAKAGDDDTRWEEDTADTGIEQVTWSPDGRLIASINEGAIHVWDSATGRRLQVQQGRTQYGLRVSWEAEADLSGLPASSTDGKLLEDALVVEATLEPGTILEAAWSPDGRRVAATMRDGQVGIWQVC